MSVLFEPVFFQTPQYLLLIGYAQLALRHPNTQVLVYFICPNITRVYN